MSGGSDACWAFKGSLNADGYGQYSAGKALIGVASAHRLAYLLARDIRTNLPRTVYIRHPCANPRCCNPAHLTVGSQRENMSDRFCLHQNQSGPHDVGEPMEPPANGWRIICGNVGKRERAALVSEFWQKIERNGGPSACWPWIGQSTHEVGYGSVNWEGRHTQAARVAYALNRGITLAELPAHLVLRHLCPGGSDPSCCNPRHVDLGTQLENMQDRMAEGRYTRGDSHFNTKITDARVRELRETYWSTPQGGRPLLTQLGEQYGIYWGTIHRLLHGKTRKDAGGPMEEPDKASVTRTNHVRGESHRMVRVSDQKVKELREEYWGTPREQRPSTPVLAKRFDTDSKAVWNWLHGKSRRGAGGPTGGFQPS
ncbi:HNH endonuclease [Streptomyces sp. NPDC059985]|uniref:HNH endonuclease n=1 Tax=Streptomyces sp. NPDC059985 TaxID=3347025 RepID=UPI0036877013